MAREAKTRAALIKRLSFGMPPHLLGIFANGILMGKILAAAPAAIPIRIELDDKNLCTFTEEINKSIKLAARTITRIKLSDHIRSEDIPSKAGLCCLNDATASIMAVLTWKCRHEMNLLGVRLFSDKAKTRYTRSAEFKNICLPVPGFEFLPSNLMAKVWNTVPGIQTARTLCEVKSLARKWAKSVPR